jgi:hypothetical protein
MFKVLAVSEPHIPDLAGFSEASDDKPAAEAATP